jgi:hypothetical protein
MASSGIFIIGILLPLRALAVVAALGGGERELAAGLGPLDGFNGRRELEGVAHDESGGRGQGPAPQLVRAHTNLCSTARCGNAPPALSPAPARPVGCIRG